jgi:hypothetical protein
MEMGELVPRQKMVNQFLVGAGGIVGGIVTLAVAGWSFIPGLIIGGIIGVVGLAITAKKENRVPGLIAVGAGALVILSKIPIFNLLASPLLWIGGLGLLALGGYSIFKFVQNLVKRM